MNQYTVFVRDGQRNESTYITTVFADSVESARALGREHALADWGMTESDNAHYVESIGVAEGPINLVFWEE